MAKQDKEIAKQKGVPFEKGVSGNPLGRPKGARGRETLLKEWLDLEVESTHPISKMKFKGPLEQVIVLALLKQATGGSLKAIEMVFDFTYGKQTQGVTAQIEVTEKVKYTLPDGTVLEI